MVLLICATAGVSYLAGRVAQMIATGKEQETIRQAERARGGTPMCRVAAHADRREEV